VLTGFEDVELERARKRQQELERNVFRHPPQSWEMFHQQLDRWTELNENIMAIQARLNESEMKERNT